MKYRSRGFTLVELLVVIAIIGVLVALLLPAVQAAREAARRTQCTDHLKNLTLGMINHESTFKQLPGAGWSGHWTGDPDRGSGKEQPGAWFYAILPFIEQQQLHDMGKGLTGAARTAALIQRDSTPVAIANCPTRRSGGPYVRSGGAALSGNGTGTATNYAMTTPARGDYAANVGDETRFDSKCLNISPNQYNSPKLGFPPSVREFTGVTFCGTAVKLRQVTDGLSNTIALGERFIPIDAYEGGDSQWIADDWGLYVGFQDDTVRSTYYDALRNSHSPLNDREYTLAQANALPTKERDDLRERFGSAHAGGCLVSMCDGSVDMLEYDIDPETFRQMGHRADEGKNKQIVR